MAALKRTRAAVREDPVALPDVHAVLPRGPIAVAHLDAHLAVDARRIHVRCCSPHHHLQGVVDNQSRLEM